MQLTRGRAGPDFGQYRPYTAYKTVQRLYSDHTICGRPYNFKTACNYWVLVTLTFDRSTSTSDASYYIVTVHEISISTKSLVVCVAGYLSGKDMLFFVTLTFDLLTLKVISIVKLVGQGASDNFPSGGFRILERGSGPTPPQAGSKGGAPMSFGA